MSGDLVRLADSIHRDKNIDIGIVFEALESALLVAAKKHYGEERDVSVAIDRQRGEIVAKIDGELIDADSFGRIAAQNAKQLFLQKVREAERDKLYEDFIRQVGSIVSGIVQRNEGGAAIVNLGKLESYLPRSEHMPGESFHPGDRVRAVIIDVRKSGQRVKVRLSRSHPDFVRKLFEQEIPEIAERIIEIRAIAREAGYRTKVAVTSIDSKVDCVGACVGVRGGRIKSILDELGSERIDIIRFNESMQIMIPNALAPAQVEEVQIYPRIGRALVLVGEDQLSLAIGKRGQNVRLASKLVGIDIEIMTFDELTEEIEKAEAMFTGLPNASEEVVDALIEEGFLSFDDISVMEPEQIMEVTGLEEEAAVEMVAFAEIQAELAPERGPREPRSEEDGESGRRSKAGPTPAERAEALLGPDTEEDNVEPEKIPSKEDVFGQTERKQSQEPLRASDVFPDMKDD